jgi:hypothetical protein
MYIVHWLERSPTNNNKSLKGTLQRKTENSKQVFTEKELRGQCPNFHIHVSVSDLYFPTINLPILLQEICGPILGTYKLFIDTWIWKFWTEATHKWDFVAV